MFERLAGLETEYALRFRPHNPDAYAVGNGELFKRLTEFLRARTPLVPAITQDIEHTYFTGYGGAVRLDRLPFLAWFPAAGVVEGATPECRGPRELLRFQRAQDVLLSRAAAASGREVGDVALLKNNRDGRGSTHGSHENYEATIASGPALALWRAGIAALLPLSMAPLLIVEVLCWAILLICFPIIVLLGGRTRNPSPLLDCAVRRTVGILAFPALASVDIFVRLLAFRQARRELIGFLVSRPVFAGAGMVDQRGRFGLSARAAVVGVECSTTAFVGRAIFYPGHVWKGLQGLLAGDWATFARLFDARQRLQIACGDANVAQVAEYLKIGTTLLVLDAMEAGLLRDAPVPRSPLRALRAICSDPSLRVRVQLMDGRRLSALQIQRCYLAACRTYVAQAATKESPRRAEAQEVLDLWEQTLAALEEDPRLLIGKLDWVTKQHLLGSDADPTRQGAAVAARHKLDLRYHELTREGYLLRLEAAGIAPTVIEPEDVLSAVDAAPQGTPAEQRGRLIRTLAGTETEMWASWSSVVIGTGYKRRVVRLVDPSLRPGNSGNARPATEHGR